MEAKKRSEIDDIFKWNLEDMYATIDQWQQDVTFIEHSCAEIAAMQGTLTTGEALATCLNKVFDVGKKMALVEVYATMKLHEDANIAESQRLAGAAQGLYVKYSAATSFITPEILQHSQETVLDFIATTESLAVYDHYLKNVLREKAHVLSTEVEAVLANAGEITSAPQTIYEMLDSADMKFGIITDENGNAVEVTHGRYGALRQSLDRRVRKDAFETYYASYEKLINTISTMYAASVKKDNFLAKTRKFESALDASLAGSNIPTSVYTQLIESVRAHLPSMHRYYAIRKQVLGLENLHMYDMSVPLVREADMQISYQQAKEKLVEGLAPLGKTYIADMQAGMESGWIDVYENEGKHSGAYSWGTSSSHPYVLLNYENKLYDMFTLAHEMGHAMHSYYSWGNQPEPYVYYTTFLAEVASTVNETILIEHMLKTTTDPKMRAYLIVEYIDQFRGTVFRQTMFAEFEKLAHEMADRGEPLTVESLCAIYGKLSQEYAGPGVIIDSQIAMEWAIVPHFYNAYYVYQYATGYAAAIAFSKKLQTDNPQALEDYLGFLKSGSSAYSIDILKKAGVDMSTPEPVNAALSVFEGLVAELEQMQKDGLL